MNYRIIIISFMVLALIGCSQKEENVGKAIPVKIYKVKSESISQYIRATGSVAGDEDVILYSKVAERVEKINVEPGQAVAKNQILVEQKNDLLKQGLEYRQCNTKNCRVAGKISRNGF